jgi:mannose-6-phosphate isomerase
MLSHLYPLVFAPVFKERVWGGRALARWFDGLPDGPVGEGWVLSDHPQGRTPVQNGPLAGETLTTLRARYGADLFGTRMTGDTAAGFPLLFKLLDCQDDLSVQVHPDDSYPGLPPGELGKTEMWVVLAAEPGAQVVYGLKEGVTVNQFAAAVAEGRTMDVLRQLPARAGDVLYVPAGTVHALGRGLLVAEIQQSSDTTYRVYDYNRVGLDGKPRELHVEQALAVTRYEDVPAPVRPPEPAPRQWQDLVRSPYFVTQRGRCEKEWAMASTPESFQVLFALEGKGRLTWAGGAIDFKPGATMLVPALLGAYTLSGQFSTLLVTLPE